MWTLLRDLFAFMRLHKKFWLAPVLLIMVALGAVLVLVPGSPVAPFIYTIF